MSFAGPAAPSLRFRGAAAPATGPAVLVPIHRSPIDIAAVLLSQPDARFLAASELFRIPLLGATMRALDCVAIDRSHRRGALAQIRRLATSEDKRPLVVFAEGGIRSGGLGKLHSGAFVIAATRAIPVVPVAIWGAADVLPPDAGLKVRPGRVVIELAPPIYVRPGHDHRALRQQTSEVLMGLLASGSRAA